MTLFHRYHPFTILLFFLAVILSTGVLQNPALILLSCLISVITFYVVKNKQDRSFGPLFVLCILAGLINPLISHHGATILFYINETPITKEACIYGVFLTFQLLQLIIWFKILSLSMTSEHIMCLFGRLSPRLALLFSMTLRFVPEFTRQFQKTENAAIARGVYKDGSLWDRIKGKSAVFLSVSGYAIEHGVITADSMEARGYSLPHHSSYERFKIRKRDVFLICIILLLATPLFTSKLFDIDTVSFYPVFSYKVTPLGFAVVLLPGCLLTMIPLFIKLKEARKWKK